MEEKTIHLSHMPKTWILDLDGTIVKHDGPFLDGEDSFLPGAKEFLQSIPKEDMIVFLTARTEYEKPHTCGFCGKSGCAMITLSLMQEGESAS